MDYHFYEPVLKYYKSFCTKTSDLKTFFGVDSSFFFIGESGQTLIAYGKEDIERQIEEQFWFSEVSEIGNTLIAFNINIEKKNLIMCPKTSNSFYENQSTEVAVIVVGSIKGIHTEDDIRTTKAMGRRFVQTFLILRDLSDVTIKTTFFSYLVPTFGLLNTTIKTPAFETNSEFSEGQNERNESEAKELDFQKIVDNIDKLIDESNCSVNSVNCSDVELSPTKVESNLNELMPISVDEVFDYNFFDESKDDFTHQIACEQYLKDVWTQTYEKSNEISEKIFENDKEFDVAFSHDMNESQNSSTSFADVLRDNLQSWQSLKDEEKTPDIKIIPNCKSKFKPGGDRRYEFCGHQNITIVGVQNLEDFYDNQILFVANIPIGYPKIDFKKAFETYGKVLSIKFVERIGVTFAFVYFESSKYVDEVMKSVVGYSNLYLNGLQLKVERYKRRIPSNVINN